jgi:hypothetical protein
VPGGTPGGSGYPTPRSRDPEFSLFHFFHFSLYLDGTKWVCTARDVPGTKTSGRNGKMWKEKTPGDTFPATCCTASNLFFSFSLHFFYFLFFDSLEMLADTMRGQQNIQVRKNTAHAHISA